MDAEKWLEMQVGATHEKTQTAKAPEKLGENGSKVAKKVNQQKKKHPNPKTAKTNFAKKSAADVKKKKSGNCVTTSQGTV